MFYGITYAKPKQYNRAILAVILGLALLLRLHFIFTVPPAPLSPDELGYTTMAKQFLEKGILGYNSTEPGTYSNSPNAFVTPGYPLFVAALYKIANALGIDPFLAIRLIQVLLSIGVVWFIFALACRLGGTGAGYLAAVLASVYPAFVYANARILTEVLFTFLITWYAYLVFINLDRESFWHHAAAGAVLALATLVRPAVFPLLFVPYLLNWRRMQRRIWLPLLGAVAGFCLIMLPWWVRNYLTLGELVFFATQTGNPFLRGADPYDPFDHVGPSVIENVAPEDYIKVGLQRIREGLKTDPWLWISWYTVGKLKFMWWGPWGFNTYLNWLALPLHRIILFLGFAGTTLSLWKREFRWLAAVPLVFTALQMPFIPLTRYVFPTVPLVIVLASTVMFALFHNLYFNKKNRLYK